MFITLGELFVGKIFIFFTENSRRGIATGEVIHMAEVKLNEVQKRLGYDFSISESYCWLLKFWRQKGFHFVLEII